MVFEHSPAPFDIRDSAKSPAYVIDANGEAIAAVYLVPVGSRKRLPRYSGNLTLFKAAPAMLEALETALNFYGEGMDETDETEMRVLNGLRAAIAQAKGEQ